MKTTNSKLQKAGIGTLAILAVIFTTNFTVSAQGSAFESRFDGNGELASVETVKAAKTYSLKTVPSAEMAYYAEFLKVEEESELAVETWMTEAAYFGVKELEEEMDEVLKVEDWMINELLFKVEKPASKENQSGSLIVDKNGKTIGINLPEAQFGRRTFILVEMEDEKLELEQWMVDNSLWVRK